MSVCESVCACVCVRVSECVCAYMHVPVPLCLCVYMRVHLCVCVCVCVCDYKKAHAHGPFVWGGYTCVCVGDGNWIGLDASPLISMLSVCKAIPSAI